MNLRFKITTIIIFISHLMCFSQIRSSRIIHFNYDFQPQIDSSDLEINNLFKSKKLNVALSKIETKIELDSMNGKNYFNRALLAYYKNNYYNDTLTNIMRLDSLIYRDCLKAISLDFNTAEVHYLIFSQFNSLNRKWYPLSRRLEINNEVLWTMEIGNKHIDTAYLINEYDCKINYARMYSKFNTLRTYFGGYVISGDLVNYEETRLSFQNSCFLLLTKSRNGVEKGTAYYCNAIVELKLDKDTIGAIKLITNAINEDKNNLIYYSERAMLKYLMGNYKGAIEDYNFYLSKRNDVEDLLNRGNCYSIINNEKLAIKDYSIAILMELKNIESARKDNEVESVDVFTRRLSRIYYNRGLSYLAIKNKMEACKDFNQALNLGNKNVEIELINEVCE